MDKPTQRKAQRPYMDKHLGVILSMFLDLKHMLQGDTMIAILALSIFQTHNREHQFAQQYRHRPSQ